MTTTIPPLRVTISKCDGEYRVPAPDGREAGAYYTDDRRDAADTALAMWQPADIRHFQITFKTVARFPRSNRPRVPVAV